MGEVISIEFCFWNDLNCDETGIATLHNDLQLLAVD